MNLEEKVMQQLKVAMKAKDTVALASLRAIKSAIIKAKTETGAQEQLSEEVELKILQKEVKQRKEAAEQFIAQGADQMANDELEQAKIIEKFLPEPVSEEQINQIVKKIITDTGAQSIKDMGKVMGMASKQLAGKASGKTISNIVKNMLSVS